MGTTTTASAAQAGVGAKRVHAGANVINVVATRGGATLTAAAANIMHMAKVPTGARFSALHANVESIGGGTYQVVVGTETIGTACVAAAITSILDTKVAKGVSASASATAWRYINVRVLSGTTTTSCVARLSIIYDAESDPG